MRFSGIGGYVRKATDSPMIRNHAAGCEQLNEIGGLIGQAYERPEHAAGILANCEALAESLLVRATVASDVISIARSDLLTAPKQEAKHDTFRKPRCDP
jgi:hypothetical protein